jgi:hypothetical protein
MKNKILLGFEVGTGEKVELETSHLIVTGLSQKAGKTTCLESMIKRSGRRAIVFRTKIGEKSFLSGTMIPPYFKDKSDWQFIEGLVEATIKEKMRSWERAKIIQLCKQTGGNSLLDFKKKVDARLIEPKLNSFEKDILTNLQAYLELVLPKLQSINFSNTLQLVEGLNIIDLERFSRDIEVQSLIIRSVIEEILYNFKDVIVVIPEFWKFSPQDRGNPCKQIIEEFVRQGATNGNYIWIDSQDMTGVDKQPLKQVSEWILGYQSEENEVKKTLSQIPLPKNTKPKPEDIMSLGTGVFYLATRERTIKTYILPFWLDEEKGKKVATGELKLSDLDMPETITPFKIAVKQELITQPPTIDFQETSKRFNKELSEMGTDFFNKIADIQEQINKVYTEIFNIKNQPKQEIDEETIIRKVIQKMPINNINNQKPYSQIDEEMLISKIISKIPKSSGSVVYEVFPLEKIKKDFLEEAKSKILTDISSLNEKEKRMIKFLEVQGKETSGTEIITKSWHILQSGSSSTMVGQCGKTLSGLGIARKGTHGGWIGILKDKLSEYLQVHSATEEEIENLYQHILAEMLK